jgi:BON domain
MIKLTLCAVFAGLSILGCDSNTNRPVTSDRTTSPSPSSPAPSATSPSATASSPSAGSTSATDQALSQRIASSLREDSSLAGTTPNITVEVNNGTVTLKGSVNSQQQRSDIESKVRNITGVTQVVNNLEIASASR